MSEYHAAEPVAGPSMDLASGSEQDEQLDLASGSLAQHGRRVGNNKLITAKGKGKGSSLKRSRSSTVDSDLAATTNKPKRKRNRAALSCAPCKKRKIKCDRKLPCESCIKRGEQASCRWEQPKVEPPPQIFALAVEHEQLKRRVFVLEQALARLAPDLFDEFAATASTSAASYSMHQLPAMALPVPPPLNPPKGSSNRPRTRRKRGEARQQLEGEEDEDAEERDHDEMGTDEEGSGGDDDDDDEEEEEEGEQDDYETDNEVVEGAAHALKGLAAAQAQNHNTRSSSSSANRAGGPSHGHAQAQAAAAGAGGSYPTATYLSSSSTQQHERRASASHVASSSSKSGGGGSGGAPLGSHAVGSPLRTSTSSTTQSSRHGVHQHDATAAAGAGGGGGGGRSVALSHTPEPIDEVAARAMASLLPRYSATMVEPPPAIAKKRRAALEEIFAVLPSRKAETDWMLNNYFTRVDWAWHLHHKPTFLAEYEAYSTLRSQGRQYSIDPLWVAYFALTLALSVKSLEAPISTPLLSITGQDLDELPAKYVECAERALECAEWLKPTTKPRFRTVQAIVLFAPYYLFAGNAAAVERHQFYLSNAIRMAQQLKLHRLGSDPTTMPPYSEDSEAHTGLPPGVSSLKREMALRLMSTLLFLDYTSIRSKTLLPPHLDDMHLSADDDFESVSAILANAVDSALPGNYNDVDLVPEGIVPPRPDHLATDTSLDLVRHRIALEQYQFKEGLGQSGEVMTYEVVLATDARYQAILNDIPADLSEAYIPPLGEPLMTLWRRSAVVQGIHSRILRLHRPYVSKGRTDETYRFSTERAISAARVILATQVSLSSAPLLRGAFQIVNIQLAVIVLFSTLWQADDVDDATTPEVVEEDVAAITSIFGWLERHASSRVAEVRLVASSSLKAFRMLMTAYQERKARREAMRSSGWPSLSGDDESFGDALRRISTMVAVPDILAAGGADETMYVTPAAITAHGGGGGGSGGSMSLDALLTPSPMHHQLSSGPSLSSHQASPFAATPPLGMTPRNDGIAGTGSGDGDFDRTLLEGLEFGDPSFSWSTWSPLGSFATLGTF
ncbi:hypothetical protein B0A53_01364 [Rhodotorula sp. CCFEE 5036]|nr:hypothetical protein B0A53_01364 [Rhodotorula sp. CCFEE 5036]